MSQTSQPPRRDIYAIEQETKAAPEAVFSCPEQDNE